MYNTDSLDSLCGALAAIAGTEAPSFAAPANEKLKKYAFDAFSGRHADRILMYNPDAVAEWIYRKYSWYLSDVIALTELELPMKTVMPSVTPVCFGTMYTGAQPDVHGIRKYEKPVITVDTMWDALVRAGKKAAIVADNKCSMGKIFLGRNMDYFLYDTVGEINARAAELIIGDEYDFIAVYNGNYDHWMHKFGPESPEALSELRSNNYAFSELSSLVKKHWTGHDTLVGFAMDHGCHEIDGGSGSHGLDMEEDLNIVHLYKAYPRKE
ncbi:MAG: alkaline phosphatase family protein [Clostridia bacterium]|nr:alkaline phosphatase family protein [Clostridia bacterium]